MKKIIQIFVIACGFLFSPALSAQTLYQSVPLHSKIIVKGTSSLHEWKMETTDIIVDMEMESKGDELIIKEVRFRGSTEGLKSDHNLMNSKTYDALKAKQYPKITFMQTGGRINSFQDNSFDGVLQGKLEIAGTTRNTEIPFNGYMKSDQEISVSGKIKMKMSDFGIKAPTAMMGTIKTGDEISLEYKVEMKTDKSLTDNRLKIDTYNQFSK